jgi:hypothetical protein
LALQFLLHLIGDLHQPLHASDARDRGGNDKQVSAAGERAGTLHYYWDTVFVERAGRDPTAVARELIADISWWQRRAWRRGSTADWAMQSFEIAKTQVYGKLPRARGDGTYPLDERYVRDASLTVRRQLQITGVRLARVLNDALR